MKKIDFEDYLQEKHSEQYIGLDDDMPDDFSDWLTNLDPQELIDYGQDFAEKVAEWIDSKWIRAIENAECDSNQIVVTLQ